jgi:DNA-binding CsgD family transcriptional regulator
MAMETGAPEEFSARIGAIYDCAIDPSLWPATLRDLCERMDFRTAVLALQALPSGRVLLDVNIGIAPADVDRMRAKGGEVVESWGGMEAMLALPLEEPHVQSRVNPAIAETRFAREWALPLGLIDTLAINFSFDHESVTSLGFGRHVDDGPIGEREVSLARLYIPHLKRALTISRLLDAHRIERSTYREVLDALSVAVLLVASDLRLLHANRAGEALLRTSDPLGLRHGRLSAPAGLASALAVALAAPIGGIGRRGLGIPARRSDGEEMVLHVLPLAEANPLPQASAAIFVAPASAPRPAPMAALAALFDLTPAEARVLELIGAGRTKTEAAEALGVGVSTVGTQMLRVFEKTCTHRQADLVALVSGFSLPLA